MFSKAWSRVALGASAVAMSFGMAANAQALEVGQCMSGPEMTAALKAENQRSVMTGTRIGVINGENNKDYAFKAINALTSTEKTGFKGYILQQELNSTGKTTQNLCVDAALVNITLQDTNAKKVSQETLVNVDRRAADAQCKGSKTCGFHNDIITNGFNQGNRVVYQGFDPKSGQIITFIAGKDLPSDSSILKTDPKTGISTGSFAVLGLNYTAYANDIGRTIPAPGTNVAAAPTSIITAQPR
jgi:hypothetical protein